MGSRGDSLPAAGRWTGLAYDKVEPELRSYVLAAANLKQAAKELRKGNATNQLQTQRTTTPKEKQ